MVSIKYKELCAYYCVLINLNKTKFWTLLITIISALIYRTILLLKL